MATTIKTTFKLKRGTAQRWRELNPILAAGEPGFELDQGRLKVGNGVTPWNDLAYIGTANLSEADIERILAILKQEISSQELTPVDGTIVLEQSNEDTKTIRVGIADVPGNSLRAVEGGLFVPEIKIGSGLIATEEGLSVNVSNNSHGLRMVDGTLSIGLATSQSDGAMSKTDKAFLDSIPDNLKNLQEELQAVKEALKSVEEGYSWIDF